MPRSPFLSPPPDPKRLEGMLLGPYLDELAKWLKALVRWITEDAGRASADATASWRLVYVSASVAARSSGSVAQMEGPTMVSSGDLLTAYNAWESPVPATRRAYIGPPAIGEAVEGYGWYFKQWDCTDWSPE